MNGKLFDIWETINKKLEPVAIEHTVIVNISPDYKDLRDEAGRVKGILVSIGDEVMPYIKDEFLINSPVKFYYHNMFMIKINKQLYGILNATDLSTIDEEAYDV